MTLLGIGHDLVDIAAFAALLEQPGSRFSEAFSPREWRYARMRAKQYQSYQYDSAPSAARSNTPEGMSNQGIGVEHTYAGGIGAVYNAFESAAIDGIHQESARANTPINENISASANTAASKSEGASNREVERHLAASWAGKECVVKAWTAALGDKPYPLTLDEFRWRDIEILRTAKGNPVVKLSAAYSRLLAASLADEPLTASPRLIWQLSLTHEAGFASGVAMLCGENA